MLPFLQKKEASTAAEPKRELRKQDKPESSNALELAMKDLFAATDNKGRAKAFKAAFLALESKPHKEASNG